MLFLTEGQRKFLTQVPPRSTIHSPVERGTPDTVSSGDRRDTEGDADQGFDRRAAGSQSSGLDASLPSCMSEDDGDRVVMFTASRLCSAGVVSVHACLLTILLSSSCAKDPLRPPGGRPIDPFYKSLDFSPTWCADARWIAYRRIWPSSDGTPGLYIISRWGGTPRYITGANSIWPADMRFSPDGQSIAAAIDLQLAIIDITSGAVAFPTHTDNRARFPDWSPDGKLIVYSRLELQYTEPPDSTGLHLFEPATGRDWPIAHNGQVVIGVAPRWSPDGQWIAFISTNPNEVGMVRPDGSQRQTLFPGQCLERDLRWYRRRLTGTNGVVCVDLCEGTFFVDAATGRAVRVRPLGPYDEFSPDGEEFVTLQGQPGDSVTVVFTQSVDDMTGARRFQVTRYSPAPPAGFPQ